MEQPTEGGGSLSSSGSEPESPFPHPGGERDVESGVVPSTTSVAHFVPTGVPYVEWLESKEYALRLRDILEVSVELYKRNWLNLTGVFVLIVLVIALTREFGLFVALFMINGYMVMILNAIRGDGGRNPRETRFGDIFTAWSAFFPVLGSMLGLFGLTLIAYLPTLYLLEETSLPGWLDFVVFSLGTLVLFALMSLFVFSPLIILEHYRDGREGAAPLTRAGARAANEDSELPTTCGYGLATSWVCSSRQVKKQYMAVLTGLMSCFCVAFSGLILFGIGVLVTFPIASVFFVVMFREMFGVRESDARPGNCLFCACK